MRKELGQQISENLVAGSDVFEQVEFLLVLVEDIVELVGRGRFEDVFHVGQEKSGLYFAGGLPHLTLDPLVQMDQHLLGRRDVQFMPKEAVG